MRIREQTRQLRWEDVELNAQVVYAQLPGDSYGGPPEN